MNYVNLTSDDYHFGGLFNEVDADEETRIDAVIADLDDSVRGNESLQSVQDEEKFIQESLNFVPLEEHNLYYLKRAKIYYIPNPTSFKRQFLGFSARHIISLKFGAFVIKVSKKNNQ